MKKNKKLILAITIGILCTFGMIGSSTYSLWRITDTQTGTNKISSACLDITMQNETGTYELTNAWPMSEEEGTKLTGYTFEVKNNCDTPVNYIVGLNSLETESQNYFDYSSIRVMIDEDNSQIYGDLNVLENSEVLSSRLITRETVAGKTANTHNIKLWVDEDAPTTEQSKEFNGQVFIIGGQGILSYDDCFSVYGDGTLNNYNDQCGTSVKIPAIVDGREIKKINMILFEGTINTLDLSELKNLESIEAGSFENIGLQKVILPENGALTNIGGLAFRYNNITSVNIPDTVTTIGSEAFSSNKIKKYIFQQTLKQ